MRVMSARIFQPARTAMQSGRGKSRQWILEYEPAAARAVEPLMGWTSSSDMLSQVRLPFATQEEAIAYARRNGIAFTVSEGQATRAKRHSYAENFRFDRTSSWTH
jgi:hypothetical protein